MSRLGHWLAPIILTAAILAVWEAWVRAAHISPILLPPPSAIARAMVQNAPLLLASAGRTLGMALAALVVASLVASALALAVALSPLMESAVKPLAVVLQATPIVSIAPLVNIWAGLEHPERAVIGLAALVAFFPIFSGMITGLKAVDPDLERLFSLYGARRMQKLLRLRLPSATPFVLEGHKVAAGLAVVGAVVAEFVSGSGGAQGLAFRLLEASQRLQTAKLFAALILLGVMGAAIHALFQALESWALRRWRGR